MKEISLTLTEIETGYQPLKSGDFIRAGDIYHRRDIPTTGSTEKPVYTFSPAEEALTGGKRIIGLMYLDTFPRVLRPNDPDQQRRAPGNQR